MGRENSRQQTAAAAVEALETIDGLHLKGLQDEVKYTKQENLQARKISIWGVCSNIDNIGKWFDFPGDFA